MEQTNFGVEEFVNKRVGKLKDEGVIYLIFLLADGADTGGMYDSIRTHWHRLDSITGHLSYFVFFAEEYRSLRHNIGDSYAPRDMDKDRKFEEMHISAIPDLKMFFEVGESQMPCLAFWNLLNDNKFTIPLGNNTDIIETVRQSIGICENGYAELASQVRRLNEEYRDCIRYEKQRFYAGFYKNNIRKRERSSVKLDQIRARISDEEMNRYKEAKSEIEKLSGNIDSFIQAMQIPEKKDDYNKARIDALGGINEITKSEINDAGNNVNDKALNELKKCAAELGNAGFIDPRRIMEAIGLVASIMTIIDCGAKYGPMIIDALAKMLVVFN